MNTWYLYLIGVLASALLTLTICAHSDGGGYVPTLKKEESISYADGVFTWIVFQIMILISYLYYRLEYFLNYGKATVKENDVTNMLTCPKCNGSKRVPPTESIRKYLPNVATYDAATDTIACDNCGSQTMSLRGTGVTRDGCLHEYEEETVGNCYHKYTCTKCGDVYNIDSGD